MGSQNCVFGVKFDVFKNQEFDLNCLNYARRYRGERNKRVREIRKRKEKRKIKKYLKKNLIVDIMIWIF